MNAENENAKGDLKISNEVIAQFAGLEARGCFGIVGIGALSKRDGFAKVLKNHGMITKMAEKKTVHLKNTE